jgi:hypothetical protein
MIKLIKNNAKRKKLRLKRRLSFDHLMERKLKRTEKREKDLIRQSRD